jgi:hypothetical protein
VAHASRALVWLKPDLIIVYDRADSPAGRFKRVWTQLPQPATVSDLRATMTTTAGQRLFVTALLPAGASMRAVDPAGDNVGDTVAQGEPMTSRLVLEAPDGPRARFLQIYQGADPGAQAAEAALIRSASGDPFEGAAVGGVAVIFPVDSGRSFAGTRYTAPTGTSGQIITGLTPGAGYTVTVNAGAAGVDVSVTPGGTIMADSGGVVAILAGPTATYLPLLRA